MTDEIKNLVKEEIKSARTKFAPFNSSHEGYAVILEEIEEAEAELELLRGYFNDLWKEIKEDNEYRQGLVISSLRSTYPHLIKEFIQVGAMIECFQNDVLNKDLS
jgi:hypothetical protein